MDVEILPYIGTNHINKNSNPWLDVQGWKDIGCEAFHDKRFQFTEGFRFLIAFGFEDNHAGNARITY